MSRWERWTTKPNDGLSLDKFLTEQETPAQMAQRMGLQSDGSGGYVDPSTGQVVARTVNNELVFYDPMGGAISAQSDGAALTQAQPSSDMLAHVETCCHILTHVDTCARHAHT